LTGEQQELIAKAEENVHAAKLLLAESLYDIAVSRAYYAMFYVAEAFLLNEGISLSKHSGVIAKSGELYAKTGRGLAVSIEI
jgi:uncharacterized protein (UPF0332 family)